MVGTVVARAATCQPVTLAADEHAPGRVRRELAAYAADNGIDPDVMETAKLLASELVTNAYRAYERNGLTGKCVVSIHCEADELVVLVADRAPGVPVFRSPGRDAESGRGLALVMGLSHQSSWVGGSGCKAVWFSLRLNGSQPEPNLDQWGDL